MADTNVYISPLAGGPGNIYYFPKCHIYGHLDKHLSVLEVPKGAISLDMLFSARTVRVVGTWEDDQDKHEYDSLTAFYRLLHFVIENEDDPIIYQFHWSSGGFEEPDLYVKLASVDWNRPPGHKGRINYNIVFRRITEGE